jgi:predicted secreted protein
MTRRHARPLVALALAGAVTLSMAPLAQAAHPVKKYPVLIVTQESTQVRLAPGERVKIQLTTNRTTGYSYIATGGCCAAGDLPVATLSKGAYRAPTTDLVGAPGTTTWTVTARRPGTTDITVVTRPPGVQNTMQDEQIAQIHLIVEE